METPILQFGTSRFLQAHADLFVSEAMKRGEALGPITIVQTTGSSERSGRLTALAAPEGFPVHIKGKKEGRVIDEVVRAGEQIFASTGCATCHSPVLQTGPSSSPLFHHVPVPLFSDLLLHDIGTGDGIAQSVAAPEEIRTPALWGLRFRRPLLHDGSAATIEDAIRRHNGEADSARRRFEQASSDARAALLAFLRSL